MSEIAYGIDGGAMSLGDEAIYDGVIIWVMDDGTWVNRWADAEYYIHRAVKIDAYIAKYGPK